MRPSGVVVHAPSLGQRVEKLAVEAGLTSFPGDVLQDLLLQRQLRHQPLKLRVLLLQLLEPFGLLELIGDEVMALFIPGICGPNFRWRAAETALALREAVGYSGGKEPWMPIGIAVNAGVTFVGDVGSEGWWISPR